MLIAFHAAKNCYYEGIKLVGFVVELVLILVLCSCTCKVEVAGKFQFTDTSVDRVIPFQSSSCAYCE